MPSRFDLTPEAMALYRETARRRGEIEQRERMERRERAWMVARQAADLLRDTFHASQVMVFGSLVHGFWFSRTSDIDLAVWGLKGEDYFQAVARLLDLSPEYKVDLLRFEDCKPEFRAAILKEGKPL